MSSSRRRSKSRSPRRKHRSPHRHKGRSREKDSAKSPRKERVSSNKIDDAKKDEKSASSKREDKPEGVQYGYFLKSEKFSIKPEQKMVVYEPVKDQKTDNSSKKEVKNEKKDKEIDKKELKTIKGVINISDDEAAAEKLVTEKPVPEKPVADKPAVAQDLSEKTPKPVAGADNEKLDGDEVVSEDFIPVPQESDDLFGLEEFNVVDF